VSALETKTTIDYIDTVLTPSDHVTMQGLGGFSFGFITELGIDEVDFNDAFLPFNNTAYRQAISDVLSGPSNTEKISFVAYVLGTGGVTAYSPIPGCIQQNSGVPWYDPNTDDLNNGGYDAALTLLIGASGTSLIFPLAADLCAGAPAGTATWNFSAPYPVSGGLSYNPYAISIAQEEGGSGYGDQAYGSGANGGLEILTRMSDQRSFMGPEVVRMLGANFTWWYLNKATSSEKAAWQTALKNAGLPLTDTPYISCTDPTCTLSQVMVSPGWVMTNYCYEMYTAGYSYGFTPDGMLSTYVIGNAPSEFDWSSYHDEICYSSSAYSADEAAMESASTVGYLSGGVPIPSTSALAYCWDAQTQLMQDAALYTYWAFAGYSPCISTDNQSICSVITSGTGFNNWWTFLNAYPTTGSPGYSTNSLTEGLRSPPLSNVSPITASDYGSVQILPEIYDSLLNNNPYNLSQLIPYIGNSWGVGGWRNPGEGGGICSVLTFTLRSDVYWQDVPGPENRVAYTLDNGTELNGPLQSRALTPLDVAFSMEYEALGYAVTPMYIGGGTYEIDHVTISPTYQPTWDGMLKAYPGNSTDVGFPWANETWIASQYGVTPTGAAAWPLYNELTPTAPAPYLTTQQYVENFVQFNSSMSMNTISVYLSKDLPYLGAFYIGGYASNWGSSITMLPMDIFSHIALGAWYTVDKQGNRRLTPSATTINYLPGVGADLEYGTGAYVLASANPTSGNYELEAYEPGMTYGPSGATVTTAHGFFWHATYSATITAHDNTKGSDVSVAITEDGASTGFSTPHTFTGLAGTLNFSVPSADSSGNPFLDWNTSQTTTTITVSSGGTYTAYYQSVQTPTGLVGYWKFDEGSGTIAHDSSCYGNSGTLTGYQDTTLPQWVSGIYGKALKFDGVDDFVQVPDSSSLDFSSAVTVMAWVYLPSGAHYGSSRILDKDNSNGATNLHLSIWDDAGHIEFGISGLQYESSGCVPRNAWTNVAATYNGSSSVVSIYINGSLDSSYSMPYGFSTANGMPLCIGAKNYLGAAGGTPHQFCINGTLDDVRIYNTALSQQEIQTVMSMPPASVYLNPSRVSGVAGQIVNATLEISNVMNLFEFEAGCTFNPLAAHCLAVFDGGFLGSLGGSELSLPGTINNTGGIVAPYGYALLDPTKAPTGSGALLIFEFQMVATGHSDVHVIDWIPIGTDGNDIPTETIDYSTTLGGVVQTAGNPEGYAATPPYVGFNALKAQATSVSVNGVLYNGNMTFAMYSSDANVPNNNNQGFLDVTIPKTLMTCNASSQWYVCLNGVVQSSRVVSGNATDTFISLQFTYNVSELEQVEILSVYYWSPGQYQAAISSTGKNVAVSPATCAQVTFANVTATGALTMNVTQPSSNATGLTSAANSVFVTFQTTATYHGNVTLQFKYNPAGLSLAEQEAMRLWLWNTTSNTWRDITTYVNTTADTVYGVSPHLSCFGITCTLSLIGSNGQQIPTIMQTPVSPPPGLPSTLEALAYYNITATAQYVSPVIVQLAYDPSTISPQQALFLQMWLWNTTSSAWVEIPTKVDTADNVVYGVSPHLSCFGITCLQPFPAGITMTSATCSKTIVGKGYDLFINVSVKNQGISAQTFTIFVYANSTAVYTEQIQNLPAQALANATFKFTANLAYGNYSMSANGQPISWLKVTIPGDINGDGVVNLKDVTIIALYWLQRVPPAPANADIYCTGVINIKDVTPMALNWLKHA
jgi:hypothetical protein